MFPAELKIRTTCIRPATILAPMAGVTDTVFRRVIRSLGSCGLIMTEFTSAEGLTRNSARTLHYLYFDDDEHPIAAQIFGSDPQVMASAAALTEDLGFDQVDINLGCPVKKVVKCGGSGLLRDLAASGKVAASGARRGAHSADDQDSFRLGREQHRRGGRGAHGRAESGIEAIAVHPRTRMQGYSGLGRLERDPRGEAGGAHSGDRQRRYSHAAGCRAHDGGNGMRRGDDRARGFVESVDFPADCGLHRHRDATTSRPKWIAIGCFPAISAA